MRSPEELRPSPQTEEMLRRLRAEYPPLTPVDESELFVRYANNRQRLEELLVLHHVTFIVPYAKRWAAHYRDANVDDMIQCGFIGLWKAAKKFDPETYKVRFSTYAGYSASAEMQYIIASVLYEPSQFSVGQSVAKILIKAVSGYYLQTIVEFRALRSDNGIAK